MEQFIDVGLYETAVDQHGVSARENKHGVGRDEALLAREHIEAQAVRVERSDHVSIGARSRNCSDRSLHGGRILCALGQKFPLRQRGDRQGVQRIVAAD